MCNSITPAHMDLMFPDQEYALPVMESSVWLNSHGTTVPSEIRVSMRWRSTDALRSSRWSLGSTSPVQVILSEHARGGSVCGCS